MDILNTFWVNEEISDRLPVKPPNNQSHQISTSLCLFFHLFLSASFLSNIPRSITLLLLSCIFWLLARLSANVNQSSAPILPFTLFFFTPSHVINHYFTSAASPPPRLSALSVRDPSGRSLASLTSKGRENALSSSPMTEIYTGTSNYKTLW